jgi:two-component system sensor histidine kinase SenX3
MRFKRQVVQAPTSAGLPELLLQTLENLDGDSLILAPGDVAMFKTPGVEKLGLLKDGRLDNPELLATVRVVRRSNTKQTGRIDLPRGPIGEGKHELTVNVLPLTENQYVLVLISDESEAQRIHDIRRDFVANISHELKTPIGALSLLSEAVLGSKDEPESVVKFATRMQSEAKRLTDLVQEIINLSRLQDSDPLQEAHEVAVSYLVKEAMDQSQINAENRGVSLTFTEESPAMLLGDRDQLTMAMQNLIDNAINYSPENTKVAVTSRVKDGIVEISVTDQGIGIPEADLLRIFERFYRVDPARSRQTGGTGLGLSIVKHVAAKHGGDVKVWSAENVGSTFTLMLPIYTGTSEGTK